MTRLLRRVSWLSLLTLAAILPLVHWNRSDDTVRTAQWTCFWFLAGAGFAAGAAARLRVAIEGSPLRVPVIAFASAMALLPLTAFRVSTAYEEAIGWLAGVAVCGLAAFWLVSSRRLSKFVIALVIAHLAVAIYAIIQYAGLDWHRWAYGFGGRPHSTMGNPNFLGGHFALLLPWALSSLLFARTQVMRGVWFMVGLTWALVVLVAQTRSAWLASGASLAWFGWSYFRAERERVRSGQSWLTALVMAGAILGALALARNPDLVDRVGSLTKWDFGQVAKRYAAWHGALIVLKENPVLGTGLGCFKHGYGEVMARCIPQGEEHQFVHTYSEAHTHNDFLQFLTEAGMAGFLVLVFLLACTFLRLVQARGLDGRVSRVLLAGGIALTVHGFLNLPFHIAPTAFLLWVAIGLAARRRSSDASMPESSIPAPGFGVVYPVLAVAVAVGASVLASLLFTASVYTRAGKDAYTRGEWLVAQTNFEKSMKINWDDRREHFFAGSMRFQRGENLEAVELFKREIDRNPYFMDGYANLGSALGMLGELKEAEAAFRRAIELNPAYAEAHANLGVALLQQDRLDEAETAFRLANVLEPDLGLARSGLKMVLDRKGGKL